MSIVCFYVCSSVIFLSGSDSRPNKSVQNLTDKNSFSELKSDAPAYYDIFSVVYQKTIAACTQLLVSTMQIPLDGRYQSSKSALSSDVYSKASIVELKNFHKLPHAVQMQTEFGRNMENLQQRLANEDLLSEIDEYLEHF